MEAVAFSQHEQENAEEEKPVGYTNKALEMDDEEKGDLQKPHKKNTNNVLRSIPPLGQEKSNRVASQDSGDKGQERGQGQGHKKANKKGKKKKKRSHHGSVDGSRRSSVTGTSVSGGGRKQQRPQHPPSQNYPPAPPASHLPPSYPHPQPYYPSAPPAPFAQPGRRMEQPPVNRSNNPSMPEYDIPPKQYGY